MSILPFHSSPSGKEGLEVDHWLYRKRQDHDGLLELWKEVQPRLAPTLPTSRLLPPREDGAGVRDDNSSIFSSRGDGC